MKRTISILAAALFFAVLFIGAAEAQTNPNLITGQVLTAAQWNALFAAKQDVLGYTPLNTAGGVMTGPLITAPSSSVQSGFNLPPGIAPGIPNNGDLWSTTAGLFVQINGTTIGPLSGATSSSFAATSPITLSFPSGVVTYACPTCGITGSPLSQFASTTSAQLRGILSDETGTGVAVFQNGALGTPTATSLALGGATIGSNALAVTGTSVLGNTGINGTLAVQSSSASALAVGLNGATNPALQIDASTASSATGIAIKSQAAGGSVTLAAISSAGSEVLSINSKGSAQLNLGNVSSGGVLIGSGGGGVTITAPITESGAASGTCANGWAENSSHQLILVACPGAAASIQVGTTTVTSGTTGAILYNNGGTLSNVALASGAGITLSGTANATIALGGTNTAHGVVVWEGSSGTLGNAGPGNFGQYLGGRGASTDPAFLSGPWTLLCTLTASSSTNLNDQTCNGGGPAITTQYNDYLISITNLVPASGTTNSCIMQVYVGGSLQTGSTSYSFVQLQANTSGVGSGGSGGIAYISCSLGEASTTSNPGISGDYIIKSASSTTFAKSITGVASLQIGVGGSARIMTVTGSFVASNAAIGGIQVCLAATPPTCNTNGIASGTVKIYGRL